MLVFDTFEPTDDITLVFFHWLIFVAFRRFRFILSSITLPILPSLFFAWFNRRVFRLLKKFALWSFRVMKQLLLPLINILFNAVLFSITLLTFVLILSFVLSGTFLQVEWRVQLLFFYIHLYLICICRTFYGQILKFC